MFAASIYRDSSNYEGSYKSKSYVQPRLCLRTGGLHADPPPSCLNCALCTIQPPAHRPRPLRKPLVDIQNGKLQLRCARALGRVVFLPRTAYPFLSNRRGFECTVRHLLHRRVPCPCFLLLLTNPKRGCPIPPAPGSPRIHAWKRLSSLANACIFFSPAFSRGVSDREARG